MPRPVCHAALLCLLFSAAATAQTPAGAAPPTVPSEEEIRRALEQDAAANKHSGASGSSEGSVDPNAASGPVLGVPVATGGRSFQSFNPDLSLIADFAFAAFSPKGMENPPGSDTGPMV